MINYIYETSFHNMGQMRTNKLYELNRKVNRDFKLSE